MKNNLIIRYTTCAAMLIMSPLSQAHIEIHFQESAPKDIFSLENLSKCTLQNILLEIDLEGSLGRLIFDTTASGAGVEVFQPFEVRQGSMALTSSAQVADGDTALSVRIDQIMAGETVSFTIDVDDTLAIGELGNIRVTGSEIEGATARLKAMSEESLEATFSNNARAILELPLDCSSAESQG